MGSFNNMIHVDDWMAIQYDIITTNPATGETKKGTTMEFARFGDYGELGAKVYEGWGRFTQRQLYRSAQLSD